MTDPESVIASSTLYRSVAQGRSDIEIWDDDGFVDDEGRAYFSIVSCSECVVRRIKYVRVKDGVIENRTYDENGDDLWLTVE